MNLLFVVKTVAPKGGRGGAERVLSEVTARLVSRGHRVGLMTFDKLGDDEVYGSGGDVERIKLGVGKAHRRATPGETVARVRRLRSAVTAWGPDVAVGFMHSAYVPLGLAMTGSGIPIVASEHTTWKHYHSRPLQRLLVRHTMPLFAAVTAISAPVREGFPDAIRKRMVIIPNPVSAQGAAMADPRGGERKTLLTVGRMTEEKDHRTLIAAFARLAQRHPEWNLRMIGDGPLRPHLEAQVEKLGLQDRISMPGTTSDISSEYSSSQLFAMPSKFEGFGLATAEALCHGLPAVGFAEDPGTSGLVRDGFTGVLVAGQDRVEALSQGLDRMMSSPDLRVRLGEHGPETMKAYDPDIIAGQWEQLLINVIASRGTRLAGMAFD